MEYKLSIISPKINTDSIALDLANRTYKTWAEEWSKIYSSAAAPECFRLDDFYRQDFIAVIESGTEVAGFWTGTSFNTQQVLSVEKQSPTRTSYG